MSKGSILIVDDEQPMRRLLRMYLADSGYETEEAADGETALTLLKNGTFHLVLLDVMMPVMDGWETCKKLREISNVPVIMLTARGETSDKVKGLRIGADDYITKPFEEDELLARIEACLRRSDRGVEEEEGNCLKYREIEIYLDSHDALYNGKVVNLTPKEFDLLTLMLKNRGRVFSREDLLSLIWTRVEVDDYRTVDTHVKNLREKLREVGAPAHDLIKTVWGVGYKLQ